MGILKDSGAISNWNGWTGVRSQSFSRSTSRTGAPPAGTASFAAPEVLRGERADCRSDIWSLGKVLALLLPERRAVIHRCTAQDPGRRYADAAAVASALRARPWLFVAAGILLAGVLVCAGLLSAHRPETPPALPAEERTEESVISDPAAIDELFRQATEMILSEDDQ